MIFIHKAHGIVVFPLIKAVKYTVLYLCIFVQFSNTFFLQIRFCDSPHNCLVGYEDSLWEELTEPTPMKKWMVTNALYNSLLLHKWYGKSCLPFRTACTSSSSAKQQHNWPLCFPTDSNSMNSALYRT